MKREILECDRCHALRTPWNPVRVGDKTGSFSEHDWRRQDLCEHCLRKAIANEGSQK